MVINFFSTEFVLIPFPFKEVLSQNFWQKLINNSDEFEL